ncbi:MAG: lysostaphin resistance A-like protein [Nitrospinota bacterium]
MERQETLKPGELAPPVRSLFAYVVLAIVVAVLYLTVRLVVLKRTFSLVWDLYLDEFIFFFVPLMIVMFIWRLDTRSILQLRRVAWRHLPVFAGAGFVLVAFQVFLLALASRVVPDIARYLDLNSYFGYESITKTILALPWAGQLWVVGLAPALIEELLFRGYIQTTLVGRLGVQRGIWVTAALFALVHLGMLRIPFDLIVSYIMGYMVVRYRSVWPAVVFHLTNNVVNLAVLNFLPGFDTEQLSGVSLVLMAVAVAYMGWKIVRFLLQASAELRVEAALMP